MQGIRAFFCTKHFDSFSSNTTRNNSKTMKKNKADPSPPFCCKIFSNFTIATSILLSHRDIHIYIYISSTKTLECDPTKLQSVRMPRRKAISAISYRGFVNRDTYVVGFSSILRDVKEYLRRLVRS